MAKVAERKSAPSHVGARGEGIIRTEEAEYRILFTNRAIAEAESATGKGIIGLLQGFQIGTTGLGDVARLLAAGLEAARRDAHAGGRPLTIDDAYRIMDEVGFAECTRVTVEAVSAVMAYKGETADDGAGDDGADGREAGDSPNA